MSSKRQPSKQQRQAQNQKQRAALQARKEAAAAKEAEEASAAPASPSGGSGSLLSRLRGSGATNDGTSSSDSRAKAARPVGQRSSLPPGHRAALSALIAAIAGAVVGSILFPIAVDRSGEPILSREALIAEWATTADQAVQENPNVEVADIEDWSPGGTEPYIQAFFPISLAVILPVIGAAIGFRAVSRRASSKVVNRTMYITLFGTLLTSQLLLVFLPSVIALAVAAFQVRKSEVNEARAAPDGVHDEIDSASTDVDQDEVIDVDAVAGEEPIEADVIDDDGDSQ